MPAPILLGLGAGVIKSDILSLPLSLDLPLAWDLDFFFFF